MERIAERTANQAELAQLLGVSATAIHNWKLDVVKRTGTAVLHRVGDAVTRRIRNLLDQIEQNTESLTVARIRLANAQSEKVEIETETLRGKLIPVKIVERVWCDIAERMKSKLLVVPSKVGLVLAGTEDVIECEEHVRRAMHDALGEIADFSVSEYLERLAVPEEEIAPDEDRPVDKTAAKPAKRRKTAKRVKRK